MNDALRRSHAYNDKEIDPRGGYVAYWMQSAVRLRYNHALSAAILKANELGLPLALVSAVDKNYKDANDRSWHFFLGGLREVAGRCGKNGMPFLTFVGKPDEALAEFFKKNVPSIVYTDEGYLPHARAWRESLAKKISCPLIAVDTNLVVPVRLASPKEEIGARTLRPKIHALLSEFLIPHHTPKLLQEAVALKTTGETIEWSEPLADIVEAISANHDVAPVKWLQPGEAAARATLDDFIERKAKGYAERRNEVGEDGLSNLSPYLHFGQLSPLEAALAMNQSNAAEADKESFVEELVVRRELAHNFVWYNPDFNSFAGLDEWAKKTLDAHRKDRRDYVYTREQFETAATRDPYWNAAQNELLRSGKMHGYMRMYWAKKILEWSASPEEAFRIATHLNDTYELDGRDPNGYAGIAWAVGGKHDRPWFERPVYGLIRYMNANGLKSKMKKIGAYLEQWR